MSISKLYLLLNYREVKFWNKTKKKKKKKAKKRKKKKKK